ncbi:peptide deformylase [Spirochaetota bacterium]
MAIHDVLIIGNPKLRKKSKNIIKIDKKIKKLTDDLIDTMYEKKGVGLAGVQIGKIKNIFALDIENITQGPIVFINPVIEKKSRDYISFEEGCLSLPGYNFMVKRHQSLILRYQDIHGEEQKLHASGILAIVIQHEMDHLNGNFFIENLDKKQLKKAVKKLADFNLHYDKPLQ